MPRLFLGRHGEASYDAPSDRSRPLSEQGIKSSKIVVEKHIKRLSDIQTIWCSDLLRAQQTARIYAATLNKSVQVKSFLRPDSSPERVIRKIEAAFDADVSDLLIVGHQPLLGELQSLLCEGNCYSSHPFVTSEITLLQLELVGVGLASFDSQFLPV